MRLFGVITIKGSPIDQMRLPVVNRGYGVSFCPRSTTTGNCSSEHVYYTGQPQVYHSFVVKNSSAFILPDERNILTMPIKNVLLKEGCELHLR
jgi:hypothetical protein